VQLAREFIGTINVWKETVDDNVGRKVVEKN
jgi:hypothetical protein